MTPRSRGKPCVVPSRLKGLPERRRWPLRSKQRSEAGREQIPGSEAATAPQEVAYAGYGAQMREKSEIDQAISNTVSDTERLEGTSICL
jgi:hypothetical protein